MGGLKSSLYSDVLQAVTFVLGLIIVLCIIGELRGRVHLRDIDVHSEYVCS